MYIYQADVWCDDCGKEISNRLRAEGKAPEDYLDQTSYDSDDFPKWADDDQEADTPQHCGAGAECLDPTILGGEKYGRILGYSLTAEGAQYVIDSYNERRTPVTRFWLAHFDLLCHEACGRAREHACVKCGDRVRPYDCEQGKCQDCAEEANA